MIDPLIITTISVGELPPTPITLDSLLAHELTGDLYKGTVNELLQLLRPLVGKLQFEIVEMDVNTQYIIDNFDSTGLGINICLGFAICNGNNGTKNRDGRSSIAYGIDYNFIGSFGGEAEHILTIDEMPIHNHTIDKVYNENVIGTFVGSGGGSVEATGTQKVSTSGNGFSHNTYHPYVVTLIIMKL